MWYYCVLLLLALPCAAAATSSWSCPNECAAVPPSTTPYDYLMLTYHWIPVRIYIGTCCTSHFACCAHTRRFVCFVVCACFACDFFFTSASQWYCDMLQRGFDTTVCHPNGTVCDSSLITPTLQVHGMWPQLDSGAFLMCCAGNDSAPLSGSGNATFDPSTWGAAYATMLARWGDPAQSGNLSQSSCPILWAHEWIKHVREL